LFDTQFLRDLFTGTGFFRLAAQILAPRVAAWEARAEIAGVWG